MRRNDNNDRSHDQNYYDGQDNNFDRTYDSASYGGGQNNRGNGAPIRPNNGYQDNYNNSNNYQDNNGRDNDNYRNNNVRQGENCQDSRQSNTQRPTRRDNSYRPMDDDMQIREQSVESVKDTRAQGVDMSGGASNVVVSYPKTYQEIKQLIDSLRAKQAIIIDIIKLDIDDAQRVLDFMTGANYALNGSMQRLNTTMFLFTPGGVSIKIPYDINAKRTK